MKQAAFLVLSLLFILFAGCGEQAANSVEKEKSDFKLEPITGRDDPDMLQGVRTKWLSKSKDARNSIIPDLNGLSAAEFVHQLEILGVNAAEVNLEPRRSLLKTQKVKLADLTEKQIDEGQYTPEQRDEAIIQFLKQLKAAKESGKIAGSLKFLVHQRLYPRQNPEREQQFIEDMSDFIQLAKANQVDDFLLGIRFGENGIENSNYLLQFALTVTEQIDLKTDGWLKQNGTFLMGGGERGPLFKGINTAPLAKEFFQRIAKHTASFSFGYKHFLDKDLASHGYNAKDKESWKQYLLHYYGLEDIRALIDANKKAYPKYANLVFTGDSGDSVKLISDVEYQALTEQFRSFGKDGFNGNIGMNGYTGGRGGTQDDGKGLLSVINGKIVVHTNTLAKWRSWPN